MSVSILAQASVDLPLGDGIVVLLLLFSFYLEVIFGVRRAKCPQDYRILFKRVQGLIEVCWEQFNTFGLKLLGCNLIKIPIILLPCRDLVFNSV